MRHFKLLFSLALILTFAPFLNAQTYDLAVVGVITASNASNSIPAGISSPITITVKNNGTNSIPTGTPMYVAVSVNGNVHAGPDTFAFNGALPAGGEFTYTTLDYEFQPSTPNIQICGVVYFTDSALEQAPPNNLFCDAFTVTSAVSVDWSCDTVTIHGPSTLDMFDLDNGQNTPPNIDSATFMITNRSNITYPRLTVLHFVMSLAGNDVNISGQFSSIVDPGAERTFILNPSSIPDVPNDSGTFNLCIAIDEDLDDVDSNDISCDHFTIIDSYDPFKPSNWPQGQEELADGQLQLISTSDRIEIQGVNNPTQITITDMQGKLIDQQHVTENGIIQMKGDNFGVYIIQAHDIKTGESDLMKIAK